MVRVALLCGADALKIRDSRDLVAGCSGGGLWAPGRDRFGEDGGPFGAGSNRSVEEFREIVTGFDSRGCGVPPGGRGVCVCVCICCCSSTLEFAVWVSMTLIGPGKLDEAGAKTKKKKLRNERLTESRKKRKRKFKKPEWRLAKESGLAKVREPQRQPRLFRWKKTRDQADRPPESEVRAGQRWAQPPLLRCAA